MTAARRTECETQTGVWGYGRRRENGLRGNMRQVRAHPVPRPRGPGVGQKDPTRTRT